MNPTPQQLRLYRYGMTLFLFGLLVAFGGPAFRNPRLILSAHLEGILNGIFLIVVGLLWSQFQFSAKTGRVTAWLLILAGYVNWTACLLGAVFGASRMTPIAGGGLTAMPWQEGLVSALFVFVGLAMTAAVAILVWGLRPRV